MIGAIVYLRLEHQRRHVLWSSLEQDAIGDRLEQDQHKQVPWSRLEKDTSENWYWD